MSVFKEKETSSGALPQTSVQTLSSFPCVFGKQLLPSWAHQLPVTPPQTEPHAVKTCCCYLSVFRPLSPEQRFSTRENLASWGTSVNVWGYIWLLQLSSRCWDINGQRWGILPNALQYTGQQKITHPPVSPNVPKYQTCWVWETSLQRHISASLWSAFQFSAVTVYQMPCHLEHESSRVHLLIPKSPFLDYRLLRSVPCIFGFYRAWHIERNKFFLILTM